MFEKKIAWPKYQLIAKRIKVYSFEEIKTPHALHNEHKQKIRLSLDKDGLINPPVIDSRTMECVSGNHSFQILRKKNEYTHIICYQALNDDECKFLSLVNKHVWESFKKGQEIRDFEFMFTDPKIFALIEKCKTLIQP